MSDYPSQWVVKAIIGAGKKLVDIIVFATSKSEAESEARKAAQLNKQGGIKEIKDSYKDKNYY